jgi:hypothetical protein
MKRNEIRSKLSSLIRAIAVFLIVTPVFAQQDRNLWIGQFTAEPKAANAVASVQQSDLDTLQSSKLFKEVTSFASDSTQPAGTWSLSAEETSYGGGNKAKRVAGIGGRAHILMVYTLRNPENNIVWTAKIKTSPSMFVLGGVIAAAAQKQDTSAKQSKKLVDALSKFFKPQR